MKFETCPTLLWLAENSTNLSPPPRPHTAKLRAPRRRPNSHYPLCGGRGFVVQHQKRQSLGGERLIEHGQLSGAVVFYLWCVCVFACMGLQGDWGMSHMCWEKHKCSMFTKGVVIEAVLPCGRLSQLFNRKIIYTKVDLKLNHLQGFLIVWSKGPPPRPLVIKQLFSLIDFKVS